MDEPKTTTKHMFHPGISQVRLCRNWDHHLNRREERQFHKVSSSNDPPYTRTEHERDFTKACSLLPLVCVISIKFQFVQARTLGRPNLQVLARARLPHLQAQARLLSLRALQQTACAAGQPASTPHTVIPTAAYALRKRVCAFIKEQKGLTCSASDKPLCSARVFRLLPF